MQIGQQVNMYWPETSQRLTATVVGIDGKHVGESGAKLLTLEYTEDGQRYTVEGIKHQPDALEGEPFWLLKGERAGTGWDEVATAEDAFIPEPQPVEKEEPKSAKKKK